MKKLFSILFCTLALCLFCVTPSFAATSYDSVTYNFHGTLNGSKNYYFNAGKVTLSSTSSLTDDTTSAVDSCGYYVYLVRNSDGHEFPEVRQTANRNGKSNTASWTVEKAGNYHLVFYKGYSSEIGITGYGSISGK